MQLSSSTGKNIPLKNVTIDINVINSVAQFIIRQQYENDDEPAEIFYKFPTPANASVYGFQAQVGEKIIRTQLKEKEEAKREYNEAISQGHGAFLMNQNVGDVFSCCLGNVERNSKIELEIKYSVELKTEIDTSQLRLCVPLTIMPRYESNYSRQHGGPSVNPPKVSEKSYTQSITGSIFMTDGIKSLDSKTDKIKILNMSETGLDFEMVGIENLDHDIIFTIKRNPQVSSAITEDWDNIKDEKFRYTTMLNVVPDFGELEEINPDDIHYTIIIDRSGSMSGGDLENAKEGAMLFINQLPDNSSFDIYHFGSDFERFTGHGKEDAISWIEQIQCCGGTELYGVLNDAYQMIKKQDKSGTILVLSDGGISNINRVLELVRANPNVTVFSIGIGRSVSKQLIVSLAEEGHGKSEFVNSNTDELQEKVLSQLVKAQTSIRKYQKNNVINIDTDGEYRLVPDTVPTLYENDINTFYVFSETPLKSATYSRSMYNNVLEKEVTVTNDIPLVTLANEEHHPIHRLAGTRLLNRVQTGKSGSQIDEVKVDPHKEISVHVSKTLGVLSKYTSFIGVEYRKEGDKLMEPTVLKEVPLQMPSKYLGQRGDVGLPGPRGPCGPCGPVGARGAVGPTGIQGVARPMGINTIGTSLKNASYNIRSDPRAMVESMNYYRAPTIYGAGSAASKSYVDSLGNGSFAVETMNANYNPFDFKLKGWSENLSNDQQDYDKVMSDLSKKYMPNRSRRNESVHPPSTQRQSLNLGYNEVTKNGFHDTFRALPKTVDELRSTNNPRINYDSGIKAIIGTIKVPYKKLGSKILTAESNGKLDIGQELAVGDLLKVTIKGVEGVYKVICIGDHSTKWVLRRV